eukprot:PhM_4_TR12172/c0_g1_i1/m.94121
MHSARRARRYRETHMPGVPEEPALNPLVFPAMYDIGKGTQGLGGQRANIDHKHAVKMQSQRYWEHKRVWEAEQRAMSPARTTTAPREKNALRRQKEQEEDRRRAINQAMIQQRKKEELAVKAAKVAAIQAKASYIQASKELDKARQTQTRERNDARAIREHEVRKAQRDELTKFLDEEKAEYERAVKERIAYQREHDDRCHAVAVARLEKEAEEVKANAAAMSSSRVHNEKHIKELRGDIENILHDVTVREHSIYKDTLWHRKDRLRARSTEVNKAVRAQQKENELAKKVQEEEAQRKAAELASNVRSWESQAVTRRGKTRSAMLRREHDRVLEAQQLRKQEKESFLESELRRSQGIVGDVKALRERARARAQERNEELKLKAKLNFEARPKTARPPPRAQKGADDDDYY